MRARARERYLNRACTNEFYYDTKLSPKAIPKEERQMKKDKRAQDSTFAPAEGFHNQSSAPMEGLHNQDDIYNQASAPAAEQYAATEYPTDEQYLRNAEPPKEVVTKFTKCPSCGANMVFDPKTQGLACPYCGSKIALPTDSRTAEVALSDALLAEQDWVEETAVFECTNCSARVVLEVGETAKKCPFCGTTNVVPSSDLSGVKPNGVLPFALAADEANAKVKKWAKKKLFAPRKFKKNLSPENLAGVYNPCFTFDSNTRSSYRGRLGERYTVTVRDSKGRSHTETRIRWFMVSGEISLGFDDVLVNAGGKWIKKRWIKFSPSIPTTALPTATNTFPASWQVITSAP